MKGLLKRLLKRQSRRTRDVDEAAPQEARRMTRTSPSPLNQVLVKPAVAPRLKDRGRVDPALTNPDPTVPDEEFDPYNTGVFDRATSWDKISQQRKR